MPAIMRLECEYERDGKQCGYSETLPLVADAGGWQGIARDAGWAIDSRILCQRCVLNIARASLITKANELLSELIAIDTERETARAMDRVQRIRDDIAAQQETLDAITTS